MSEEQGRSTGNMGAREERMCWKVAGCASTESEKRIEGNKSENSLQWPVLTCCSALLSLCSVPLWAVLLFPALTRSATDVRDLHTAIQDCVQD